MATLPRRPAELLLALRVLAVATLVPALTRLPLARQAAILEPRSRQHPDPVREAWLTRHVDAVLVRGRPLVRPGCLTRGLTHYYFLRRVGADVRLVYGIGEIDGRTEGHCWLVRDGEPYLESTDPRPYYTETYCLPRARASARDPV
jgi:hypothetical protein